MSTSDAIVVFITTPTRDEGRAIADKLVEKQLAACVQILPEMESVYRWQGKVERQPEHLLVAKTAADRFEELEREVRAMHSYDTPEIVSFPLTESSADYLRWLQESVNRS